MDLEFALWIGSVHGYKLCEFLWGSVLCIFPNSLLLDKKDEKSFINFKDGYILIYTPERNIV